MRALIVDDEAPARDRLRRMLDDMADIDVAGEAASGAEAVAACARQQAEVVLLDIRMPGMDGLEAAGHLAKLAPPPAVVFVTAYDQHAVAAFEAAAVDYLLKPVRRARLEQALQRVRTLTGASQAARAAGSLHTRGGEEAARTHLSARLAGGVRLIPVEEVIYLLAEHKYVEVGLAQETVLIDDSLKTLESELGGRFVRVHRNALVARDSLEGIERRPDGRLVARLRGGGRRLEISRRHAPRVRELVREIADAEAR